MAIPAENVKRDVHKSKQLYLSALSHLENSNAIPKHNKELILKFLRDCGLGKTILFKEKKKIKERRLQKYVYMLPKLSYWLQHKNFEDITQDDMENFISRLERNRLTLMRGGAEVAISYGQWSQRDVKVCVKKFYKWLLGDAKQYPEIVSWIDTAIQDAAPPALGLGEIRRLVQRATTIKGKALLWTIFQTGARAEEFLNIRIMDVTSKGSHYLVAIEFPKTFKRTLPIYEGVEFLDEWVEMHPHKDEPTAQLFPMGYGGLRMFFKRLGAVALGKRVTPQLMRDSFATWLATRKIGRYQMCKLMGWSMSSSMPDRYIDRAGVVEEEAIQAIRADELGKAERENHELRMALRRLEAKYSAMHHELAKRSEMDSFLTKILKDDELAALVAGRVRKVGLGEQLLELSATN